MREYYPKTQYFATMQVNLLTGGFFKYISKWENAGYVPNANKIYFVTEGECEISINGEKYIIRKNQMAVMPKGTVQTYGITEKGVLQKHWCHFDATVGGQDLFKVLKCKPVINVPNPEYMAELFKQMFKEDGKNIFSEMVLRKAMLLNILSVYLENSNPQKFDFSEESIDFSTVISYMEKNIDKKITVEEMSAILHLHPNYFIRVFKQYFGYSPIKFFNKLKADRAKQLLTHENDGVKHAAEKLGFKDVFSFSKFFKANAGMPPTQYVSMYYSDGVKDRGGNF